MRGHTAQMPSSVKCFTRTGKCHAFYDPTPILTAGFAVSAFPFNPYTGGDHPSPTSQLVLSQHSFCVLASALHQCEIISNSPASFLLSTSFFTVAQVLTQSVCLCVALQVSETFTFQIFHHLLLWSSVETRGREGREHVRVGRMLLLCLVSQNFVSVYTFSGKLRERSCSPGLE